MSDKQKDLVKVGIVALIVGLLIWGYVASHPKPSKAGQPLFSSVEGKNSEGAGDALAIDNMKTECEKNGYSKLCGDYINIVQSRGFEALSNKQGEFWAEVYSE